MSGLRIGNASGFYGDRFEAWREMLTGGPLDVLTGDYLAELTMLILGRDRLKDPARGYAKTFLRQMEECLGLAVERGVKVVTNAGGLNPAGLAEALRELAARLGLEVHIGHVAGDALDVPDALTANAYLGAYGIAECLKAGAQIVVTGRVTDASLVVGPAAAHFGWARDDWDRLAGATVAGHVLECGAQATGGNFSFFTELPDGGLRPGFPIAEIYPDGDAVITKHPGTGGAVTTETVTAQLLYEIGPPAYLGPDVTSHFDTIELTQDGPDRVRIHGTKGSPPPATVKVGVNTLGGYRNQMTFVLCGLEIDAKAALVRAQIEAAVGKEGLTFQLLGGEWTLLRVQVKDPDPRRAGRAFSQAAVELALASYPGCFLTTPPEDASPYGVFRTEYVPQYPHTAVLPNGERVEIPPPPEFGTASAKEPATGEAPDRKTRICPLGTVVGARSGDKGDDANLGVWARTDEAYEWLRTYLTEQRLQDMLPEAPAVTRYDLPNLRALNFVLPGLLAGKTRFDPQAKALGEWLRAQMVAIPEELL